MQIKGIIFDMDNTLLRSNIDFAMMKIEIFNLLSTSGILPHDLPIQNETTSTIIQAALMTNNMTAQLIREMWEITKKHEVAGMVDADLEPGVIELLEELKGKYHIAIVTNNSHEAAESALRLNGIIHYFDVIVGREMVRSLKPAADGFHYVLKRYPEWTGTQWLSIGDSWIDGKASQEAGIKFIAYRPNTDKLSNAGVCPDGVIQHIRDLLDHLD